MTQAAATTLLRRFGVDAAALRLYLARLHQVGRFSGAIDFGDCGWGHRAMDLAARLQCLRHPLAGHHDHRAAYPALHAALLDGDATERALPPGAARQVDTLITARLFGTLEWMPDDWPSLDHRAWPAH